MTKKIGILTSGGDSPGMNNIIYNIVKNCINNNYNIYGIYDGYKGLYLNKIKLLNNYNFINIKNKGGTFLGSSRFPELKNYKIRKKIIKNIKNKIDILIVIGGEGSYIGAKKLTDMNLPCITIPGTIDNDINNTDYTIGHYSAIENIMKSIDKIENTIKSHKRISIIEVMGRKCGKLAILSAISCSCDFVIIPEIPFIKKKLFKKLKKNNKKYSIIIITENIYNIKKLSKEIEEKTKKETRYTSLSYIQRGADPISIDRILSKKISYFIIKLIKKNKLGISIEIKKNKLTYSKLNDNNIININNNNFIKKWFNIINK